MAIDLTTEYAPYTTDKPYKDATKRAEHNVYQRLPGVQTDILLNWLYNYASDTLAPLPDDQSALNLSRVQGERAIAADYGQGMRDVDRVFAQLGQTGGPQHAASMRDLVRARGNETRNLAMETAIASADRSLQTRLMNQDLAMRILFGGVSGEATMQQRWATKQARQEGREGGGLGGALGSLIGSVGGRVLGGPVGEKIGSFVGGLFNKGGGGVIDPWASIAQGTSGASGLGGSGFESIFAQLPNF